MALYASIRSNALYQGEAAIDQAELDQDYIDSGEWDLDLDD